MTERVLEKALIAQEDLALGQELILQERNGQEIAVNSIDLPFVFISLAKIKSLDTAKYNHVYYDTGSKLLLYVFDSTSAETPDDYEYIQPNEGAGQWVLSQDVTALKQKVDNRQVPDYATLIANAAQYADGDVVEVVRRQAGQEGGGPFVIFEADLSAEAANDSQQGVYVELVAGLKYAVRRVKSYVVPEYFGAAPDLPDNTSALVAALDSGFCVDGGGNTYNATSITTTTEVRVMLSNINISGPLSPSGHLLDASSATSLSIVNVDLQSTMSGLSTYTVANAKLSTALNYERPEDGQCLIKGLRVINWAGRAVHVKDVELANIDNVRATNVGLGQRYYGVQSGFITNVKTKTARRIGVTCQSANNTTDHDDLQLVNVTAEGIYPGIGSGGDLHGIGVEIHNFVDEALASNIRSRNVHSMGLSLSGCEDANVRGLFVKEVGYTSESATETTYRGFAGVEIVDSDGARVQGIIRDVYTSHVRFDKSHFAEVDLTCQQNNATTSGAFRFIRYQGTANDENNASWSCVARGIYRNNTNVNLSLLDIGSFATYLEYRHKLENMTVFNCTIAPSGKFRLRNIVVEDDGTFTDGTGIGTLLDLNGAGTDIDIGDIEYIGIDSGSTPDAFCRIGSGAINAFVGRNLVMRNVDNVLTAASGTLAEMALHDCELYNVGSLYTGTISSAFRLSGSDNTASPRLADVPLVRHGNSSAGVSGQDGDILWKRSQSSGVSAGWVHDGAVWQPITSSFI